MLSVLLTILKIVLILIGVILGIALLIIAVVLFNMCRFEANGKKNDDLFLKAQFKWLFGIVKGNCEIDGDITKYNVYIPFGICNINYSSEDDNISFDVEEKNICNDDDIKAENNEKRSNIFRAVKSIFNKIKNFIVYIADKIKFIKKFNDRYCINSLLNVTIKLIIKLFKNLGFKRFEIKGSVGFDDPSDTGKALGAVAVVNTFLPFNINIDGNFESKEITGEFYIKGRTNLWLILFPLAKYIFTKPVWPVVKDYWKGELNGWF